MTQEEYLREAATALKNVDAATRDEILDDLRAHFVFGLKQGKNEQEIIVSLGDVSQFAAADEIPHDKMEEGPHVKTEEAVKPNGTKNTGACERSIVVEAMFADVDVSPSQDDAHHVYLIKDGRVLENSYLFEKTSENGQLRIRLTTSNKFFHIFDRDLQIRLEVADVTPALRIATASGDVEIKGLTLGEFVCSTASGDLQAEELCCRATRLNSASGDLHLKQISGDLSIETASGDAEVLAHKGDKFTMRSANGDLNYRGSAKVMHLNGASSDGVLNLENIEKLTIDTVSGDYRIRLSAHVSGVNLDFKGISGACDYDILGKKGSVGGLKSKMTLGDGKTQIDLRCVSGDFRIED